MLSHTKCSPTRGTCVVGHFKIMSKSNNELKINTTYIYTYTKTEKGDADNQ